MKNAFMFLMLAVSLMTGCGTAPSKSSSPALPLGTQFAEPEITVILTQKLQVEGYPSRTELERVLKEKTNAAFNANGLLAAADAADAMFVKIVVNYQRRFAGEDSPIRSKSVMPPVIGYTIVISDQGVEKARIKKQNLTINKGLGGNLTSIVTLGLGKDAKDEESDIQVLANTLASEVKALLR